jgi:hypothetical protein|nr:MAG TPA: tail protein [Caudoviricetes sp.]
MINGTRIEKIRAELLDQYSIKKCDIEIIEGAINCDGSHSIAKAGNVTFKYPNSTRLVEDNPPNTDIVLSDGSNKYYLGIDTDGAVCTYEASNQDVESITLPNIFVANDGTLEANTVTNDTLQCNLMDLNGFTWYVGVEPPNNIYTIQSGQDRKVFYRKEQVKINYLTDRIKIWYVINDNWNSLGEYMMLGPKNKNGIVSTSIMDLTVLIQRRRELDPVVFVKGTPYHDVLSYFIIKSGYTKVNIEATDAVLRSDRVFDDSKNRLEWFNEVAKEINYTQLEVDENGYFVSRKYRQPTLSNVKHIYRVDKTSIISGEIETEEDFWNTYNVIKCVHSNPSTSLLVSIARNDDPSDPFSTYAIGEVPLTVKVDNVADKQELDAIATKMLFEQRQTTQDVVFNSLINPVHGLNDVIQLFSPNLEGVFLENSWTIPLKAGSLMTHKMRRLVDVRSVVA